jgi:hypothetical protein
MAQVITDVNQNADVNLQGLAQSEGEKLGVAEKALNEMAPQTPSSSAQTSASSSPATSKFGAVGSSPALSSPRADATPIETKMAAGKMLDLAIMVTTGIPSLAFTALAVVSEATEPDAKKSKFQRAPQKSNFMQPTTASKQEQQAVYDRIAPKTPGVIGAAPKKLNGATADGFGSVFQTRPKSLRADLMGDVSLVGSSLGGVTGFKTDPAQSSYLMAKMQGLRATVAEAKDNLAQIRKANDMGLAAANLDGAVLSQNVANQLSKGQDGAERVLAQNAAKPAVMKYNAQG